MPRRLFRRRPATVGLIVTLLVVGLLIGGILVIGSVRFQYWWRMRDADEFYDVDWAYIERITSLGPEVTPLLVETIEEAGGTKRESIAYYALVQMKDPAAVPLLTKLAADSADDPGTRRAACCLLSRIVETGGPRETIFAMGRITASGTNDWLTREYAAVALERMLGREFTGNRDTRAVIIAATNWWRDEGKRLYAEPASAPTWD